jgi:ATP-dependent DNA helicase RecQ
MQGKPVAEQEIGRQLLLETTAYAETALCRRKILLHYFGEDYEPENCENCDNCRHPRVQFEGQDYIIQVLEAVAAIKEKFKSEYIANILAGNVDNAIKSYNHHKLEVFGAGSEKDNKFWLSVIRQSLVAHFLIKDIENYGLLKISPEGHEYFANPYPILLTQDREFAGDDDEDGMAGGKTSTVDLELFYILKDLRKKISKNKNIPPFVIFQDNSLEDMAIQYPINTEELQNIVGVGTGKAQRYGKEFVEIIKAYVEEKEIIRPQDMVVKSVVNKSGLKVYIIQAIDRKMSFDDICQAKNMDMKDLLTEIEAIVSSGTKLNIEYYVNEVLDEDHQDEVYHYFLEEAETENLDDALKLLGEDEYSEDEIRLMRIKFMSEMGN